MILTLTFYPLSAVLDDEHDEETTNILDSLLLDGDSEMVREVLWLVQQTKEQVAEPIKRHRVGEGSQVPVAAAKVGKNPGPTVRVLCI